MWNVKRRYAFPSLTEKQNRKKKSQREESFPWLIDILNTIGFTCPITLITRITYRRVLEDRNFMELQITNRHRKENLKGGKTNL
ncbi:hypothetical protein TNCV_4096051 [Trichonephila clavipes]|nr:hypothetical protein TNCV_4096051 [Trichonephila clavipes]